MGWLFDFEDEKKKKDTIESFINACKNGTTDEWKSENKDKEKEKDTFWF